MNFSKSKVLILGAAGSIGSALARRIIQYNPHRLTLLDQEESGLFGLYEDIETEGSVDYVVADIRDVYRMNSVFEKEKPDIVLHAAAYKHVSPMEKHYVEAYQTNVIGTMNVVQAAVMNKVKKFVFISSDKAVEPTSVMGETKRRGEKICLEANNDTKFMVVRFGNVMASRGSVIPIFQKAISENKSLVVTHKDMQRYFMGIYDAVDLILEALRIGEGGEIFVLDMGKPMYIRDLAEMMIKISGKPLRIKYSKPGSGEKFNEKLMTEEEAKVAKKVGKLFIIKQNTCQKLKQNLPIPKDCSIGKIDHLMIPKWIGTMAKQTGYKVIGFLKSTHTGN